MRIDRSSRIKRSSRVDRSSRRALVVMAVTTLLTLAAPSQRSPLLLFNRTPSIPTGLYLYCGSQVRRGDVVAFALPQAAWHYAHLRGESTDVLLLKHVLAVGGDSVSTLHGELRVNGVLVGEIATADPAGRALPQWPAARVLAGDELIVGSTHPRSFDSRYFGPIHAGQVFGVYRRLNFGAPSDAPSAGKSLHDPPNADSLADPPPTSLAMRSWLARSAMDQRADKDRLSQGGSMNSVWQDKGRVGRWRVSRGSRGSWMSDAHSRVRRQAHKLLLALNLPVRRPDILLLWSIPR